MANSLHLFAQFWKWILGIFLILLLILAGLAWYLSERWRPILDKQLSALVLNGTDSLYRIEYSGLHLNLITGNAAISDLKLSPDTVIYNKLKRLQEAPDNLYTLQVKSLSLRNFHPKKLYKQRMLHISRIIIENPEATIINQRQPYNTKADTATPKSLYQSISNVFREVRVDAIQVNDIDLLMINRSNEQEKKTSLKNLNLSVNDLLIDSLSESDQTRFYHSRNIDLHLKEYRIATADSLYHLELKDIDFSSSNRSVEIASFAMKPRYSATDFYRKVRHSKDRYNLKFGKIKISAIDLHELHENQRLYADRMRISSASVNIFNTNAWPGKTENKTGKFPHQQLQKLALDLRIDTLQLRNIDIYYREYNTKARGIGTLKFINTTGDIYNVTNDSAALRSSRWMRAVLSTRFMDAARLNVTFNFNLRDKRGAFNYRGTLGAMNGLSLNQVVKPLALVEVKSADIKRLSFNVKANERIASGKMQFYYSNLKVRLLKKDEETGEVKKQGFVSGIANVFVLHESNPWNNGREEIFIPGNIYYRRPATAGFFKFIWKSLFGGIKESVGVSDKKEKDIRNIASKVGGIIEGVKEDLEALKKKRQEKRRERIKKREKRKQEKALKQAEEEKEKQAEEEKEKQAEEEKQEKSEQPPEEKNDEKQEPAEPQS